MTFVPFAEQDAISAIFAYGTLKQGQCREACWPTAARGIFPGTVRGTLWDLGPYPGLTIGDDKVRGEIWMFTKVEMPRILQALDAVEGFFGKDGDLFVRKAAYAAADEGGIVPVWIYYYGRTMLSNAKQIAPAADGTVSWP